MDVSVQQSGALFSKRDLMRLILPLMAEQSLAAAVGLADSMMVSSVGEAAVSGVSLVDMISLLLINVFMALATGGAVITSQFLGARDLRLARRTTDQLVLVTTALSTAVTAAVLCFQERLLTLLFGRVEPDVMENCLVYIRITALSYPFIALYNAAAATFRAQNNSRLGMKVSLLMNGINVGGNALLIYGFRMGVAGVALPTLASRMVAAVVMLAMLGRKDNPLRMSPLREFRPDRGIIYRILHIGVPNALENGMFQFGKIIVIGVVTAFGTSQIAANAMSNNIVGLIFLLAQAISIAIVTVVGRCVGARELGQARRYTLGLVGAATALLTVCSIAVWLALPLLLRLYGASGETAGYVRRLVGMCCVAMPLIWAFSFVLPGALRAANDVRYTSVVAILSMWLFRVGLAYVLGARLGWGVVGVWSAMLVDWTVRSVFYLARFSSGGWLKHADFSGK